MLGVVAGRDAHEHPGQALPQGVGSQTRVLQRLPADLEDESVLRVDADRFPGGDAEELRIEGVDPLQEAAVLRRHPGRRHRIDLDVGLGRPPLDRHLGDGVDPVAQELPEGFGTVRPSGESAAQPDDGDRLGVAALEDVDPAPELLDHRERLLQEATAVFGRGGVLGFAHRICASLSASRAASSSSESSPLSADVVAGSPAPAIEAAEGEDCRERTSLAR